MSSDDPEDDLVGPAEFKGEPEVIVHPGFEDRARSFDLLYAQ